MRQRTLANPVQATGICLHSGKKSTIVLKPAPINTGIIFVRSGILIPANAVYVDRATLCTSLAHKGTSIGTIEHLMAAISAAMIDNLIIEVSDDEVPILDGSSLPFVMLIESAGIKEQFAAKKFLRITDTIYLRDHDRYVKFEPSDAMEFYVRIWFGVNVIDSFGEVGYVYNGLNGFRNDISRARTFGFMHDLETLHKQNLALGASVHNAVVLDKEDVINPDGLRYDDEFVRHKLLDAIGDTRLLGYNFIGRYEAFKPSHALNISLCREVLRTGRYELIESEFDPVGRNESVRGAYEFATGFK